MSLEIAHQRNWRVPDAVVMPLGQGTLFLGAYRDFRALGSACWTDRVPGLLGAQAAGYAPIDGALHGDDVPSTTSQTASRSRNQSSAHSS